MPVDLEQEVELAKHEREHVMQKLTKHGKQTVATSAPPPPSPLRLRAQGSSRSC